MWSRRTARVALGALTVLLVVAAAGPVAASPAPVSGCPPCDRGFVAAASAHGLDTEVRHSEATVRAHGNGSATWTARVVPTNESALARLAENDSLARAVAADSFGVRYGDGIDHELFGADVDDGAFVVRYRTLGVVRDGVLGTRTLTYFRDSPGAYVYTDLGADELTVVAPPGSTVARGFGDVDGRRMTATELPEVRDGPFVVFAPEGSPLPGLLGILAVAAALGDVIARNVLLFVAVPGGVVVGGVAAIRRYADPTRRRTPTRLGGVVAAGGALVLLGTLVAEADALPYATGNLLLGGVGGFVLLALGASVAVPGIRRRLSAGRILGFGVAVGAVAVVIPGGALGTGVFHASLAVGVAVLPAVVALGWLDASDTGRAGTLARRLALGLSSVVVAGLVASAPLTALGGTLFLLAPILLTVAAVAVVAVAVPLYLLGAAGGRASRPA